MLAGIGNVYRAEALFVDHLAPDRPAREVTRPEFDGLWATVRAMLQDGVRAGRIVTVAPADVGVATLRRVPARERVYVYKRAGLPCRRCGTVVLAGASALRTIYWCPTDQPR